MSLGKFISIEGTEGAGKSTALQFIKDYLLKANIDVVWTREPGGTAFAEEIRRMILHPVRSERIEPETELLLMFAGRAQHMKTSILPALASGKWVASDRFIDASYAYQGGGRGLDVKYIEMLDQWIVGSHYPNLTILLDLPPDKGFERTARRGTDKDRIEQEKIDFFERVRESYLERAKQNPDRIRVVDASVTIDGVENQIRNILDQFIKS